ncbi:BQ5605_C042g12038 [Microbotryum silenes-dioicae]|uniref:BQ5605_C042g12038 protein n=1 Tax=Microbotryum silenes-dioicae TaxID=796604 RepID=A0A2X0PQ08_9BASI|nr:BQ5605_C042g12038 [Microbotryum silenes-dioicae]
MGQFFAGKVASRRADPLSIMQAVAAAHHRSSPAKVRGVLTRPVMRLLAWRGRPPLKPPPLRTPAGSYRRSSTSASLRASSATTCAAEVVGDEDTVADELDTNHGATRPRPRSVSTNSFFTRIYHRFGSTQAQAQARAAPSPPAPPEQLLERVLSSLPRMANSASAVRLQHRSRDDVQQELYAWKRACAAAYVALDGPLRDTQSLQLHERIVKVVAHTLRLLIRTDQVHAAAELDKAFFTSSPNVVVPFPLLLNTQAARAIAGSRRVG